MSTTKPTAKLTFFGTPTVSLLAVSKMLLLWLLAALFGTVALVLVSVFLLYTAYLFYVHNKYSHLPSPRLPSFYLGHVADVIRLQKERNNSDLPFEDICKYWFQSVESKTIIVFIFHNPRMFTVDADVVKAIVTNVKNGKAKFFTESVYTLYGERFLGNGIVTVKDYDTWKPKRNIYNPAFAKSYLRSLVPSFNLLVDEFLEDLKPLADGKKVFSLKHHVHDFVFNVMSKIVFGSDFKEWKPLNLSVPPGYPNPFTYIVSKVFKGSQDALTSVYSPWMHYFHPFKAKAYQEAVRAMRMIGKECVEKRLKAIDNGEKTPNDVLTQILKASSLKEILSIEDLMDDFCTFYVGALDSTSNMLQFTIILLHQHPEILTRVLEEVGETLGNKRYVSPEDVEKLTYTEQVLLESLRMYSVFTGAFKELDSDLKVGEVTFPAKMDVMMASSVMAKMPEYFKNPDIFDPDNFAEGRKPSSFVFFPFSVGHRSCIGKQFTLIEAKILLSRFLQTYRLTLPENYKVEVIQKVSLEPKDDVPCTLLPVSG